MSMFPGAGAEIIRNEAGEPVGWDYPHRGDGDAYHCDLCGGTHAGPCPLDDYDDQEEED